MLSEPIPTHVENTPSNLDGVPGDNTVRLRVSREWYETGLSGEKRITVTIVEGNGKSGQHWHCPQQGLLVLPPPQRGRPFDRLRRGGGETLRFDSLPTNQGTPPP